MKYDHIVNYNGVYYKAGEDVPDELTGDRNESSCLPNSFNVDDEVTESPTPKRGRPKKHQ